MKQISLFIVIMTGLVLVSFTEETSHIRDDFHEAVTSECKLQSIIVSKSYPNTALTKAYKGLATCTSAEFATWPNTKWKYFTDGKALIEAAVKANGTNPEIRYTRMMVQLNAPALVNYSSHISSDLKIFEEQLMDYDVSLQWKESFIDNLKASGGMSANQLNQLSKLKEKLTK